MKRPLIKIGNARRGSRPPAPPAPPVPPDPRAPVLDCDLAGDADRLTMSKTLLPDEPDEWLGWKSVSGIGNPDTHPAEWNGPLGWDDDNSDDDNWIIEWQGFHYNKYFIAAYRVGSTRSPYSNIVHP